MICNRQFYILTLLFCLSGCSLLAHSPIADTNPSKEGPVYLDLSNNKPTQTTPSSPNELQKETLFDLIIAEMAAKKGRLDITLGNYLKQSKYTQNPQIIARAMRIANFMKARQAALDIAKLWLEVSPQELEALQVAVIHSISLEQTQQALEYMDTILQVSTDNSLDFLILASNQISSQQRNQLLDGIADLLVKYPQNASLWFIKGVLLDQDQKTSQALSAVKKAHSFKVTHVPAAIFLAKIYSEQNEPEKAQKVVKKTLKKAPHNKRLHLVYLKQLLQQEDTNAIKKHIRVLAKTFPNQSKFQMSVALLTWQHKQSKIAKSLLLDIVKDNEKADEAHLYLAQIAAKEENYRKAKYHFSKIHQGPFFSTAQIQLANLYAKQNQVKQARKILKNARLSNPQQAIQFYVTESEILDQKKQYKEAYKLLTTALHQFPENDHLLYNRAMIADRQGKFELLEKDLKTILARNPTSAMALNALGYTYANRSIKLEQAYKLIQKAIQLRPNDPAVIDSLGWVYYKMGENEKALHHLKKAYNLFKDHEIASHLGEVLWVTGNQDQAIEIWQDGLKQTPDSKILKEVIKKFSGQ